MDERGERDGIDEVRQNINAVDEKIVALLAERGGHEPTRGEVSIDRPNYQFIIEQQRQQA